MMLGGEPENKKENAGSENKGDENKHKKFNHKNRKKFFKKNDKNS